MRLFSFVVEPLCDSSLMSNKKPSFNTSGTVIEFIEISAMKPSRSLVDGRDIGLGFHAPCVTSHYFINRCSYPVDNFRKNN